MVDKNSIFGGMITTLGAAKKTNCDALGVPWEPRYMLIGDANGADPVPSPTQTKLINQVYRAQLNQLRVSPTDTNVLIAEVVLPPDVGGWHIRELALEDKDGVFSAVANVPPSYKPLLAQGSGRNQVVRMHIITSGTSNIQLKIDPSVVLATRQYVDEAVNGLLPANKVAGTYTKVTVNDRGVFVSGSNPTTLAGFGIKDAYTKDEVKSMIDQASASPVRVGIAGGSKGLIVSATGLNSKVSIKAEQLIIGGVSSVDVTGALNLTLDLSLLGAGGLDDGVLAASAFYHVFVIRGAGNPVAIASLSPTGPLMPAGYSHKARVSCLRTDATTKFPWKYDQDGNRVSLKFAPGTNLIEYPLMASGVAGNISTPAWQAVSLANFVPPTASAVLIQVSKPDDSSSAMLAPSPNFGGISSTTAAPPIVINCPTNRCDSRMALFPVDSANMNFYYAANGASPRVRLMGWEERL